MDQTEGKEPRRSASGVAENIPKTLFLYGSLRDPALLAAVAGGDGASLKTKAVQVRGFAVIDAHPGARSAGRGYPVLTAAPSGGGADIVDGLLATGLEPATWRRLLLYEGDSYTPTPLPADAVGATEADASPAAVFYFAPTEAALAAARRGAKTPAGDRWVFERWTREDRAVALAAAREFDALIAGGATDAEVDAIWSDMSGRALKEAGRSGPIARGLGPPPRRDAVSVGARERVFDGFFKVDRYRLTPASFAEGSAARTDIVREVFVMGRAATVLPYDPRRDAVLLIQQFRAALWAAGDESPWAIEVVAGRIDDAEDQAAADPAAATARREAMEEAGLALGRLERIAECYASPGGVDETLTLFVGEASLPPPGWAASAGSAEREGDGAEIVVDGALHGVAQEGEEIRALVMSFDAAMTAAAAGEIKAAPALTSLYWLARNRERLRALWSAPV